MNRSLIEQAVGSPHPDGWVSEMSSAKLVRPPTRPDSLPGDGRQAAVVVLIYPTVDRNVLETVLTRRKDTLQHHPGQISLPGGRVDEGETLEQAARREAEEEIGIDRNEIEILGTLNPVWVPPSDFTVTPFVGWLSKEPVFEIQVDEVAELIQVPVARLLDPSIRQFSSVRSDSKERSVPWFSVADHQVWGATAIILDDFSQRLRRVQESTGRK
ncbi:NUDIX hydrolase [Mariniblastus fucicola]|uniref:Putative NUDIX hydrolase n=1 Tax=Mariniblastus fucicola TaxID=980251 RepID=A0A5B9PFZ8_9BACT|nr:CoA pyrophosphatase [Mariniblastus fucicola]QEG25254.1 putative NUDIX hydrolase [Mariniblastus fucicola]